MIEKYFEHEKFATIYYAYHSIQRYLVRIFSLDFLNNYNCTYTIHFLLKTILQEEPFTAYQPEALFNIARFLRQETKTMLPPGVSQLYPHCLSLFVVCTILLILVRYYLIK